MKHQYLMLYCDTTEVQIYFKHDPETTSEVGPRRETLRLRLYMERVLIAPVFGAQKQWLISLEQVRIVLFPAIYKSQRMCFRVTCHCSHDSGKSLNTWTT